MTGVLYTYVRVVPRVAIGTPRNHLLFVRHPIHRPSISERHWLCCYNNYNCLVSEKC